jgi:hypothetical protein
MEFTNTGPKTRYELLQFKMSEENKQSFAGKYVPPHLRNAAKAGAVPAEPAPPVQVSKFAGILQSHQDDLTA